MTGTPERIDCRIVSMMMSMGDALNILPKDSRHYRPLGTMFKLLPGCRYVAREQAVFGCRVQS